MRGRRAATPDQVALQYAADAVKPSERTVPSEDYRTAVLQAMRDAAHARQGGPQQPQDVDGSASPPIYTARVLVPEVGWVQIADIERIDERSVVTVAQQVREIVTRVSTERG